MHAIGWVIAALLGFAAQGEPPAEKRSFYNVVAPDGADPWVIAHQGMYYLTKTTGSNVTLWRSRSLSAIAGGESNRVWTPPAEGAFAKEIWAPELHRLRGKWYIYFAADDGENAHHRMFVLENDSEDPFAGEFRWKGKLSAPGSDRWAIDGTAFEDAGKLYFTWSGWEGEVNDRQNLYIALMENPWTISGERVELARPTLPWQTQGAPPAVLEGPEVLKHGERIHLIYSASGSWTDHYCLGALTAKSGARLLDPASWRAGDKPVFSGGNGVIAPGHCSFVKTIDGKEDWLVYHSARFAGAGWTRMVRMQPFTFDALGFPELGKPASPNTPIPLPSGEPGRARIEFESGRISAGERIVKSKSASHGAFVRLAAGESVTLDAQVEQGPGKRVVALRYRTRGRAKSPAACTLAIAGGTRELRLPFTGGEVWSVAYADVGKIGPRISLTCTVVRGEIELDCCDVISNGDNT